MRTTGTESPWAARPKESSLPLRGISLMTDLMGCALVHRPLMYPQWTCVLSCLSHQVIRKDRRYDLLLHIIWNVSPFKYHINNQIIFCLDFFEVATRAAYGTAIAKLAKGNPNVIALDGDTKNSTFSIKIKVS